MAGPTASVLALIPNDSIPPWRDVMSEIADEWAQDGGCWVADTKKVGGTYVGDLRPFVGSVERIAPGSDSLHMSRSEIAAIEATTNRASTVSIVVAAMCNDRVDHRVLCEVVRFLATQYDGIVDFHGKPIADTEKAPGILTCSWNEDGQSVETQLGTPETCDWWARQTTFRMIK